MLREKEKRNRGRRADYKLFGILSLLETLIQRFEKRHSEGKSKFEKSKFFGE